MNSNYARRAALSQAQSALREGQEITIRPSGRSMEPRIFDGDAVTLQPPGDIQAGDVVLARVQRRRPILVLHQVLAVEGGKYLIGSASGRRDGWAEASTIVGRVIRIEHAVDVDCVAPPASGT